LKSHYDIAREEMAFYGSDCTSLQNLLAILIGPKATPETTGKLASLGIRQLINMGIEELKQYKEIEEIDAQRIIAAFGLANHIISKREKRGFILTTSMAYDCFKDLARYDQEHFDAIYLNSKSEIIQRRNIFKGTLDASIIHPREIFKEAIKLSASAIIVAHNHPSGDPTPSGEDLLLTRRLIEAGRIIGIDLIDHIIIGSGRYVSLKEKGVIEIA
jgi:DNA repair protein RadC